MGHGAFGILLRGLRGNVPDDFQKLEGGVPCEGAMTGRMAINSLVTSSFLFLVVRPGAPSSVVAPSSMPGAPSSFLLLAASCS